LRPIRCFLRICYACYNSHTFNRSFGPDQQILCRPFFKGFRFLPFLAKLALFSISRKPRSRLGIVCGSTLDLHERFHHSDFIDSSLFPVLLVEKRKDLYLVIPFSFLFLRRRDRKHDRPFYSWLCCGFFKV